MIVALLWVACCLLLCHPTSSFGVTKALATAHSSNHPFHGRPNICIQGTKSNGADLTANSEIEQRKDLWKSISNFERQAVKLLIAGKEGTAEEDCAKVNEAYKLLSQSASLKATDPFLVLATRYASALEKKDSSECEKILKDMKSVGVPPHIASLVGKVQPGNTGIELHGTVDLTSGEYKMEEVDAGSTFSDTVTDKIRVKVNSFYDAEKSDPANGKYMFTYKVAIFNEGSEAVQVVARMWEIEMFKGTDFARVVCSVRMCLFSMVYSTRS